MCRGTLAINGETRTFLLVILNMTMSIAQAQRRRLAAVVLSALTFILYSQTLTFDFVNWDDDVYVYDNARAYEFSLSTIVWFLLHPYFNSYTPVTMLSHVADIAVWGLKPAGHHLMNVLLHVFNAFWTFVLSLQLTSIASGQRTDRPSHNAMVLASLFAAALFAWHPLRAESVAWISDRKDLLCLFFLLPSAISYIRSTQQGVGSVERTRWYVLSLILFVLACLSKPAAVTLPLILMLVDWAVLRRERVMTLAKEKLPFFFISFGVSVAAFAVSPPASASDMFDLLSPLQRVLLPFSNIMWYLGKTIVPTDLSPIYPLQSESGMAVSFVAFVLITIVALRGARKGRRLMPAAWMAFVILLLPSSIAVQAVIQTTADRYTYLPSVALSVAVGLWLAGVAKQLAKTAERRVTVSALLVIAAFLAFLTLRQQRIWANSESLWYRAIALYPTMPLPHNNLGLALQTRGELDRAKDEYTRAIELKPDYLEAHVNLGNVLFIEGKWKEAEYIFHRAAELAPYRGEVYNNLGILANAQGNSLDALHWLRKSVEVDSTYAQGHFNLGALYAKMGNTAAAVEALQRAARLGHREAQESLKQEGLQW